MKNKILIFFYLLPLLSFIYCFFYSQYIYDGYHFGLMFSNAIDLNEGKIPYKEIFIEYGYLTTLIHSFVLSAFGDEVLYLQIYTSLIYSITIILIGLILKKFTNNYYALFAILSLFIINPIPLKPWAIYNCYLFYSLSLFFFINKNNISKGSSGIFLSLAYLSFTTLYNFIIIPLILLITFSWLVIYRENKREYIGLLYFFIGFFTPLLFFITFLYTNNIINEWITYQKLPILFVLAHAEKNILEQIIYFFNEISFLGLKNYIISPHNLYFGLIYFVSLYCMCRIFYCKIFIKKSNQNNTNLLFISIFIISLTPHAQVGGVEKFSTSISLGIIVLLILIYNLKLRESRYFIFTFLIFTTLLIAKNNYNYPEYSSLKINIKNKYYNDEKIKFYQKQKWSENKWNAINGIVSNSKKINNYCKIYKSANLTDDAFYYSILENKAQIVPFFFKKHGYILRNIIEPDLINNIQADLNSEKIYLVSSQNNNDLFKMKNYKILKKFSIDEINLNLKNIYLMVPTSCFEKINS
jgi:hypothetical protein